MCLIKVRKEEEEDVYVPYRRVVREERIRTSSPRRSSRVVVAHSHASEPRIVVPAPATIAVPAPKAKVLPPPQPVPVFVAPSPPPPVHHHPDVHYVHVSPRSSVSDHDDYRYERREVRYERDYSPARSSRGDNYEYRYVGAPAEEPRHRRRERSRSRSRVREYYEDDDEERRTTVKVSRKYRD
jgi:hypothetical protein